jgi:choline dehydrogenase-like flavoprotein
MDLSADYVVVGAGSAGCIIARRLADTGASVILLEAGRRDNTQLVRKPGMIGPLHSVPQLKKIVDWGHYSTPQPARLGGRRLQLDQWDGLRPRQPAELRRLGR